MTGWLDDFPLVKQNLFPASIRRSSTMMMRSAQHFLAAPFYS
jgi:hypothetical protein